MPRLLGWVTAALLLSHCATKHQPIEFAPYFPDRPETQFSGRHLLEMRALETKPSLTLLEKKRLWELYNLELKGLKPNTQRYAQALEMVQKIQPEVQGLEKEVQALRESLRNYKEPVSGVDKPPVTFENAVLRRQYNEAYRYWNRDNNDVALKKINDLVTNGGWKEKVSKPEWFKLLNLRFRVALDSGELAQATTAYDDLKNADECAPETAYAGFLVALHTFSAGEPAKAWAIFDNQCDPDKSSSNMVKRKYWKARFHEAGDPDVANKYYEELLQSKMAGYYVYLVKNRLGGKINLPSGDLPKTYLAAEVSVSREVDHLLTTAEERLQAGLRRDATVFLTKVSQELRSDVKESTLFPLLYTAHLFQASGSHLEAMKIYGAVTSVLQEDSGWVTALNMDFLPEMFPRPFNGTVEWLARSWDTDPDFVYAIMRQESAFNPGAVSAVDARGLMQLMPSLARSLAAQWNYSSYYSDRLLFHAEENLKLATYHLHQLRALAPHHVLMSAAYNAGLSRVNGWWKKYGQLPLDVFVELIPINETRNYVKLVMRNFIYYKALRTGGQLDATIIPFKLPPYGGGQRLSRAAAFLPGNTTTRSTRGFALP